MTRTISYGIEVTGIRVQDGDGDYQPALEFQFSFGGIILVVPDSELDALPHVLADAIDIARGAARSTP